MPRSSRTRPHQTSRHFLRTLVPKAGDTTTPRQISARPWRSSDAGACKQAIPLGTVINLRLQAGSHKGGFLRRTNLSQYQRITAGRGRTATRDQRLSHVSVTCGTPHYVLIFAIPIAHGRISPVSWHPPLPSNRSSRGGTIHGLLLEVHFQNAPDLPPEARATHSVSRHSARTSARRWANAAGFRGRHRPESVRALRPRADGKQRNIQNIEHESGTSVMPPKEKGMAAGWTALSRTVIIPR